MVRACGSLPSNWMSWPQFSPWHNKTFNSFGHCILNSWEPLCTDNQAKISGNKKKTVLSESAEILVGYKSKKRGGVKIWEDNQLTYLVLSCIFFSIYKYGILLCSCSCPLSLTLRHFKFLTLFFFSKKVGHYCCVKKTNETRQSELFAYITRSPVHALLSCQILCNLCHFSKSADVHCVHAWGQRSSSGLKAICAALLDSWAGQIFWMSERKGNRSHSAFRQISEIRHSVQVWTRHMA